MDAKTLHVEQVDGVEVFHIKGYVAADEGLAILNRGLGLLTAGSRRFVLDFEACQLVNSTGMVSILNLAMKAAFEYRGQVVISGLDDKKALLFEMLGICRAATTSDTLAEAIQKAKGLPV